MIQLIGLGIALAVFLVLWIMKTAKDGNYSSPFGDSGAELARAFSILLAFMVALIAPFFLSFLWGTFGTVLGIVITVVCFILIAGVMRREKKRNAVLGMIVFLVICIISCVVIAFSFSESGLQLLWLGGAAIIALLMMGMMSFLRDSY